MKYNYIYLIIVLLGFCIMLNFYCFREGFVPRAHIPMRTCYPSGSDDVSKCFTQPSKGVSKGVYITAAKVGRNACPWGNGGDPAYWEIIKKRKKETGLKVWGLLNMVGSDPLPSWPNIANCLKGSDISDPRHGLFDGLLIDAEHLNQEQCDSISDLSYLGMPTLSTIGSGTCQNFRNPKGHGYIAMCYDGAEKKTPCSDCTSSKMKGVDVQKYMYSMDQWPDTPCSNKPIDIYGAK